MSLGLLLALAAALAAGVISGYTGFGLALVLVPALLLFYNPATVVPAVVILGIVVAVTVVLDSWREVRLRPVLFMLPFAFAGLLAGSQVLKTADPEYIRLGAGIVVVCAAALLAGSIRIPGSGTRAGAAVAGALSGTLSTSVGLPGPPVVLLFAARGLPKQSFRGSSAAYFLVLNLAGISTLFIRGVADVEDLPLAAGLIPAAVLGKALGTVLVGRTTEKAFRRVALGTVALTGLLGALTAAFALL